MTKEEQKIITGVFQEIVDDYGLNYGNGEITFETYNGPWIDATIEAPNNSVVAVQIDGTDYEAFFENGRLVDKAIIRGILASEIHKAIEEWDAEETFKELWSRDFQYGPFEFADMLQEDEKYLDKTDNQILEEAI